MSKFKVFLLLLAVGWALPSLGVAAEKAHPGVAYCYSSAREKPLMTDLFMTSRTDQSELDMEWKRFASTNFGQDNPINLGCYIYPWASRHLVIKARKSFVELMKGWLHPAPTPLAWRPEGGSVKGEAAMLAQIDVGAVRGSSGGSGGSITIEDNGIAARTKAFDDAVLQGQRAEAQRKVAAAAVSARQDAKIKALIAAEMDKMRKRGNKQ